MSIQKKNKFIGVLTAPFRFTGKILKAVGRFLDKDINEGLTTTDEAARLEKMKRVQQITMENAPWVFLFNPGYQLATRANVGVFSWYTPNGNAWFDFSKQ